MKFYQAYSSSESSSYADTCTGSDSENEYDYYGTSGASQTNKNFQVSSPITIPSSTHYVYGRSRSAEKCNFAEIEDESALYNNIGFLRTHQSNLTHEWGMTQATFHVETDQEIFEMDL